jgi:aryl-alcohol dehydrogenase-like predicted oxidoreductase
MLITAFNVLGAGVLSGKYNQKTPPSEGRAARWGNPDQRAVQTAAEVVKIAQEIGCSPAQVAFNWVRQQPGVVIPLIGARRLDQMRDNLGCLDFTLTDEQMSNLDKASPIELGYPHDFLASEDIRDLVYGGTYGSIDNHRP